MLSPSLIAFGLVCVLITVLCLVIAAEVAQARRPRPQVASASWQREGRLTLARWRRVGRWHPTLHS
jgi:hypothetical protein